MNETAITTIEKDCLGEMSELSHDEVLAVWDRVQFYSREIKRIKELVEAEVLRWVQAHGDLIASPTVRYYAGIEKKTVCNDVLATVEAVLDATGGDLSAFCEVLASSAIKHGAAKAILPPEKYAVLFRVEEHASLEEGKSRLLKVDSAFVKQKKFNAGSGSVEAPAGRTFPGQPAPAPSIPSPTAGAAASSNAPAGKGRPRSTKPQCDVCGGTLVPGAPECKNCGAHVPLDRLTVQQAAAPAPLQGAAEQGSLPASDVPPAPLPDRQHETSMGVKAAEAEAGETPFFICTLDAAGIRKEWSMMPREEQKRVFLAMSPRQQAQIKAALEPQK